MSELNSVILKELRELEENSLVGIKGGKRKNVANGHDDAESSSSVHKRINGGANNKKKSKKNDFNVILFNTST